MKTSDNRSIKRDADLPRQAANDTPAGGEQREPERPTVAGWDAFEVWRTRVRDARQEALPRRGR